MLLQGIDTAIILYARPRLNRDADLSEAVGAVFNFLTVALISIPFINGVEAVFSEEAALATALVPTLFSALVVMLPFLHRSFLILAGNFRRDLQHLYHLAGRPVRPFLLSWLPVTSPPELSVQPIQHPHTKQVSQRRLPLRPQILTNSDLGICMSSRPHSRLVRLPTGPRGQSC
jgi:hypothetical protein